MHKCDEHPKKVDWISEKVLPNVLSGKKVRYIFFYCETLYCIANFLL